MTSTASSESYFKLCLFFFFFNDTATTEIYTLSLHDALPISPGRTRAWARVPDHPLFPGRSEEHTSELQSRVEIVCRLLLEKKKKKTRTRMIVKKKKYKSNKKNIQISK